jgi:hypothetical protein
MARRPASTVGTRGLALEEAAPPGFPHALEGQSFVELRDVTTAEWNADTAWLVERKIELGRDNSFNHVPPDWRCPGCGRSKYETIRRMGNGRWSSDVQDHHILGQDHTRFEFVAEIRARDIYDVLILICARCNLREAARRLAEGTIFNSANPWAAKYRAGLTKAGL